MSPISLVCMWQRLIYRMTGEEALDSDEEREIQRQEEEEDQAAYEPEFGAQDVGE